MLISVKVLTKYIIIVYAFGSVDEKLGVSDSKAFQSPSICEISGRAWRKKRLSRSKLKQALLIDSDAERFLYLRGHVT